MGCRGRFPLAEGRLVRLSAGPDGSVAIGPRLGGRGAWVCGGSETCLLQSLRRRSLARALRVEVGDEAAERLRAEWRARQGRGFSPTSPDARD